MIKWWISPRSYGSMECAVGAFIVADVYKTSRYRLYTILSEIQRKVEKRLRTRLLPILENQKERTERRMYLGKKLDMRAIADPGGAVYKRIFPGKKTDAVVCVLVDNSGSMIGHRIEAAIQVSKEDKEEQEGADEKSDLILQKILLDLVSETVDQDMGVEAQNRLQEELDGMEFEAAHNMVKKEVLYKNTFTETEKSWLSAYEASAKVTYNYRI